MTELEASARDLGFSSLGVIPAEPSKRLDAYLRWIEQQQHGTMAYLARPDRVSRRKDPNVIVPGVQSIVCVTLDYAALGPSEESLTDPSRGRIAAYAWGPNYHDTMLPKLESLAASIGGVVHRAYVDTGAILERDHAESAGLGFTGKNTMLISPQRGSWFFLGEILTTKQLLPTPTKARLPNCGSCTRCLNECPTDAFPSPYVLDARRCISYLTIERKSSIPLDLRPRMRNWVFGCDDCQTVCPFQRFATPRNEILIDDAAPALTTWLTIKAEQFAERFRGTALFRTGRERMVRNACIAAGNSQAPSLVQFLEPLLLSDRSALVRGHAAWAVGRLGARDILEQAKLVENDGTVRGEIEAAIGAT